ncbi:erythromycin esterase family protein [Nonomuraea sp. NPDC050556]|uniref:erythromycin esterase family protein n=1 Tax=Nonomuraea sp. NPDC050556 TaxID=3364369 RepID=UPI0037BDBF4E
MVFPQLVREMVGDARVVAIGEGAHNITEFYDLKHQLLRELGFPAFVMESGFPEGLDVDAWIHGAPGRVEDVARDGITYRFGECEPMRRQLDWMRSAKVAFYGMDLPGSSTSPGPAVRAIARRMPVAAELLRLSDLGGRTEAAIRFEAMPPDERALLVEGLAGLAERADPHDDPVVRRCGASLRAFVAELDVPEAGPYPRDVFMADTVRWVLEREERVVVSAHNAHVQRTPFEGRPTMGCLLDAALGEEMVVIGMTYGSGPEVRFTQRSPRPFDCDVELVEHVVEPGSLEERMDRLDLPVAALALGGEPYDAVVHVRHATRIPGAFERLRAEFEENR